MEERNPEEFKVVTGTVINPENGSLILNESGEPITGKVGIALLKSMSGIQPSTLLHMSLLTELSQKKVYLPKVPVVNFNWKAFSRYHSD